MSAAGSSPASRSSCATSFVATSSSTSWPSTTMRSRSSRSKTVSSIVGVLMSGSPSAGEFAAGDDVVGDAVRDGLVGGEDQVAVDGGVDALHGLAGALGERLLQLPAQAGHLGRVDLQVGGLAVDDVDARLVDQHAGVGHHRPVTRGTG